MSKKKHPVIDIYPHDVAGIAASLIQLREIMRETAFRLRGSSIAEDPMTPFGALRLEIAHVLPNIAARLKELEGVPFPTKVYKVQQSMTRPVAAGADGTTEADILDDGLRNRPVS